MEGRRSQQVGIRRLDRHSRRSAVLADADADAAAAPYITVTVSTDTHRLQSTQSRCYWKCVTLHASLYRLRHPAATEY